MTSKTHFLSSFVLKIIAIVSMTFDHIGAIIPSFYQGQDTLCTVFRYLGRFALPLFCFMIAEGVIYTKNYKKYATRLGILALIISITLCVFQFVPNLGLIDIAKQGNIFIDLLLGSVVVYALKNPNKKFKLIALIPFGISILSFSAKMIESTSTYTIQAQWYPYFLRLQYDWLSILLIAGFYLSYYLTDMYFEYQSQYSGITVDQIKGTATYRTAANLISCGVIIIVNLLYFVSKYFCNGAVYWNPNIQLFSIASCLIIFFYNGKRGYDSKWFRWFSYLYYPAHILVLFLIFYLISLV